MFRRARPRLKVIGNRRLNLNDRIISYTLKRSPRAKYVRLEIKRDTGLTVVIPKSYDTGKLPDLLRAKQRWILTKLAEHRKAEPHPAGWNPKNGDKVHYLGRELEVVVQQSDSKASGVRLESEKILVIVGSARVVAGGVLEWWYRRQAAEFIKGKADGTSARLGVAYRRLTIRGQRTRWGSCSNKGNLSFNWKLLMTPEDVIDYVVVHEVAHLKEMNHTKRFWSLVAEYCPRWREHRKWLKEHEAGLTAELLT